MKNTTSLKATFFLLFLVCFCGCGSAQKTLTILHTNDTHSQIRPDAYKMSDGTKLRDVGGVIRRDEFIRQTRASEECVLLLDAGDFEQGSAYFNLFKGRVEVEAMNIMGYDAATIGNHAFDNGLDTLAARFNEARFPIVCANYRFKHKALANIVKPYTIIEKCGHKIGIFGLSPNMEGLTSNAVLEKLVYLDPVESARYAIGKLKEEKCDVIICLSHLGYDTEKPTADAMCDTIFAKHFTRDDISIIIGGHTHTLLTEPQYVNEIPIVQTGKQGAFVGKVTMEF